MKCLERAARNFTAFSDRKDTNVKSASIKEGIENLHKEIFGKKVPHN
jgi:hypothetical protein